MTKTLKIDFVSDVVCPWCAIGLHGLNVALDKLGKDVKSDITFHPYELNPNMPKEGQVHLEHITGKYGISANQARASREQIRQRAADVGFTMNRNDESKIYNTFDAHRLLAWAKDEGKQLQLKQTLVRAYFTDLQNLGDPDVLAAAAEEAGLDRQQALEIIHSDRYASQVKEEEMDWQSRGVKSVPTIVINDRYVINGGLPPGEFEQQLRMILAA